MELETSVKLLFKTIRSAVTRLKCQGEFNMCVDTESRTISEIRWNSILLDPATLQAGRYYVVSKNRRDGLCCQQSTLINERKVPTWLTNRVQSKRDTIDLTTSSRKLTREWTQWKLPNATITKSAVSLPFFTTFWAFTTFAFFCSVGSPPPRLHYLWRRILWCN